MRQTPTSHSGAETDVLSDIGPAWLRGHGPGGQRRLQIQVVAGPDRAMVREVTSHQFTVGTSRRNELVLGDPTVSRQHLRVDCSDGILVRDLDSRNGTYLGDLQIREALVPLGARLRLGRTVLCFRDASAETGQSIRPLPEVPSLIGRSHAMQAVARSIRKLAQSSVPVLVQGESGTGKELVARAIHELGPRATGPFVALDGAALSGASMEVRLFGHERDGGGRTEGAFERARGGTLFLDEIDALPLAVQPTLLAVVEGKTFRRVGGREDLRADVRIVAATRRDLRAGDRGDDASWPDLCLRLAETSLHLPPLRDRLEDLDLLVEHFVREVAGPGAPPFTEPLMAALRSHRWKGNVRELRSVVENILASGRPSADVLTSGGGAAALAPGQNTVLPYRVARSEAVAAFEHHYIGNLIKLSKGNASQAARVAGMDRPYLLTLLRKHGLRGPRGAGRDEGSS
jgi:DNA-binding NtrC family response regulator